jgi:Domain of unknown function (DUF4349)
MRVSPILLMIIAAVCLGCGACGKKSASRPGHEADEGAPEKARQNDAGQPAPEKALPRKIIYTATMSVIAEDFSKAEQALLHLVKEKQGYVIHSEVTGSPGAPRTGSWKIRVPVEQFDAFREAISRLGEVDRNTIDSQDVTDEYYDLEARIKNKKVEEARLLQHLEKSTGKLDEILAVEREVSRVRGEVEQMQGRLQMLAKLTAMTTVTVTLHERRTYIPPEAPAFGTTMGRTFQGSLDMLVQLGKSVVLIAVALAPWLAVLAVVGVPAWLVWRRRRRLPLLVLPANETPPPSAGSPEP